MSNTKHTPGPWQQNYIYAASTNEVKVDGNRIALVLQYDEKQNRVADFETCQANAKLIAAAPDLLKALDMFMVAETYEQLNIAKQVAAKAIKKATE